MPQLCLKVSCMFVQAVLSRPQCASRTFGLRLCTAHVNLHVHIHHAIDSPCTCSTACCSYSSGQPCKHKLPGDA